MKTKIAQLVEQIKYHKRMYYIGQTKITDEEFDALETELKMIDPENPVLDMVGFKSSEAKELISPKMLSLDKAKTNKEVVDWFMKNAKALGVEEDILISMPKLDGFSIELRYTYNEKRDVYILSRAVTRGDGSFGEDRTENVMMIDEIPKEFNRPFNVLKSEANRPIFVRGEIFMRKSVLDRLIIENKLPKDTDIRTIAAGSCRQNDPWVTKERSLSFYAFDVISDFKETRDYRLYYRLDWASTFGFDTMPMTEARNITKKNVALFFHHVYDSFEATREFLDFQIDGIVLKFDRSEQFEKLGYTSHHPKGAIAFKFPSEVAETPLLDVIFQISRFGTLTPVAKIEPVKLAGASVSSPTLHNISIFKSFGLKVGDSVTVTRANDVIPYILSVCETENSGEVIEIPAECPYCCSKTEIVKDGESEFLKCTNELCPERRKQSLLHFCQTIEMDEVAEKTIDFLADSCYIYDPVTLYRRVHEVVDIMKQTAGWGVASIRKFVESVEGSKTNDIVTVLTALGIPRIGRSTAEKICKDYDISEGVSFIEILYHERLEEINGIGYKTLEEINKWFDNDENQVLVGYVENYFDFNVQEKTDRLSGQSFCITGTVDIERKEVRKLVENNGGVWKSGVSKKLDYLIVGKGAGSKLSKAKELGVRTLSAEEFFAKVGYNLTPEKGNEEPEKKKKRIF